MACDKAPNGWACTRLTGHDGPCAAVPQEDQDRPTGVVFGVPAEDRAQEMEARLTAVTEDRDALKAEVTRLREENVTLTQQRDKWLALFNRSAQFQSGPTQGQAGEAESNARQNPDPRCPKCGFTLCEQFNDKPINEVATLATPNGNYRCYHCSGVEAK